MTALLDTGFLLAVLDADDEYHEACKACLLAERRPLLPDMVLPELAYMTLRDGVAPVSEDIPTKTLYVPHDPTLISPRLAPRLLHEGDQHDKAKMLLRRFSLPFSQQLGRNVSMILRHRVVFSSVEDFVQGRTSGFAFPRWSLFVPWDGAG